MTPVNQSINGAPINSLRAVREHLRRHKVKPPRGLDAKIAVVERAPEREQPRLCAAVGVVFPALRPLCPSIAPLCAAYPQASLAIQARLALGETPAQVLAGLTAREAHEALAAGVEDPVAWIIRDVPDACSAHSVAVARWIVACHADPARWAALCTERTERVAGAEVRGRLITRTDELEPVDLARGVATGVQAAFEAAARRLYAAWEKGAQDNATPLAPKPRWWQPVRCARILDTPSALVAEGRLMAHCVGSYAPHVQSQRSVVVALRIKVGTVVHASTAELSRDGRHVHQHRGHGNGAAPALCVRALDVLRRRWGL